VRARGRWRACGAGARAPRARAAHLHVCGARAAARGGRRTRRQRSVVPPGLCPKPSLCVSTHTDAVAVPPRRAQLRVLHGARRPDQGADDADEARQEVRPRAHRDDRPGRPGTGGFRERPTHNTHTSLLRALRCAALLRATHAPARRPGGGVAPTRRCLRGARGWRRSSARARAAEAVSAPHNRR
jgi:hypothetical protein